MGQVKNKGRRLENQAGQIYDSFSPYRILNIQAYPDWKSTVSIHDSTKHYLNGPEAFLVTIRAEFRDARRRLLDVHEEISDLVEPPEDFIFRQDSRDRLLFEDDSFTCSRRYFWAWQALGIMNQDITEMIQAFREAFKDHVWDGTNKIIWPGEASTSPRYAYWHKRMESLRRDLDYEISKLEEVVLLNDKKRIEVVGLRDNLFSGTSVLESRRSVLQAEIAVDQGRNIKLLTVVTIFFLPLTFVTSIFGMTNMPPNDNFYHFAWTTIAICIPTYLLIMFLIPNKGLYYWGGRREVIRSWTSSVLTRIFGHSGTKLKSAEQKQYNNPFDPVPSQTRKRATTYRSKSEHNAKIFRTASANVPPPRQAKKVEMPTIQLTDPFKEVQLSTTAGQKEEALPSIPESTHSSPTATVRFNNRARESSARLSTSSNHKIPPEPASSMPMRARTMSVDYGTGSMAGSESSGAEQTSVSHTILSRILDRRKGKTKVVETQRRHGSDPV